MSTHLPIEIEYDSPTNEQTVKAVVIILLSKRIEDILKTKCYGCIHNYPEQKYHMGLCGCIDSNEFSNIELYFNEAKELLYNTEQTACDLCVKVLKKYKIDHVNPYIL